MSFSCLFNNTPHCVWQIQILLRFFLSSKLFIWFYNHKLNIYVKREKKFHRLKGKYLYEEIKECVNTGFCLIIRLSKNEPNSNFSGCCSMSRGQIFSSCKFEVKKKPMPLLSCIRKLFRKSGSLFWTKER